jgi:hypothetical protein
MVSNVMHTNVELQMQCNCHSKWQKHDSSECHSESSIHKLSTFEYLRLAMKELSFDWLSRNWFWLRWLFETVFECRCAIIEQYLMKHSKLIIGRLRFQNHSIRFALIVHMTHYIRKSQSKAMRSFDFITAQSCFRCYAHLFKDIVVLGQCKHYIFDVHN